MKNKSCILKGNQQVYHLDVMKASSCCRAELTDITDEHDIVHHIKLWDKESKQLDQGEEIANCEYCWKDERQGKQSYRHVAGIVKGKKHIELKLSNVCNLQCAYCDPASSSTWDKSIREQGAFTKISKSLQYRLQPFNSVKDNDVYIDQVKTYIDSCEDNEVFLKLLGGEPTMLIKNLEFLQTINPQKVWKVGLVTNLNPPNNKFLHKCVEMFGDKLVIEISLDATPDYCHIPRGNFNKVNFLENLDVVKTHVKHIQLLPVISSLNIGNFARFIDWADFNQLAFSPQQLHAIECLRLEFLPNDYKQELVTELERHRERLPAWIFEELDVTPINKVRIYEHYHYVKQYCERLNIDLTSMSESKKYWHYIETAYNKLQQQ